MKPYSRSVYVPPSRSSAASVPPSSVVSDYPPSRSDYVDTFESTDLFKTNISTQEWFHYHFFGDESDTIFFKRVSASDKPPFELSYFYGVQFYIFKKYHFKAWLNQWYFKPFFIAGDVAIVLFLCSVFKAIKHLIFL